MRRHRLSVLQRAAIGKVSGEAGRWGRVIPNRRVNAAGGDVTGNARILV